ncbi:MAG TPA: YdcF family protein [Nitrospirota bacterium]|nr:YdcF family protein [Nitrospirota bacterium]
MALILPPASLIILLAMGLLVMKKYHRAGMSMLWLGLAVMYALSIQPVANGLMNRLEREYPPFKPAGKRPDVIVVLSGGVRDLSWVGLEPAPAETSLARTVAAAGLYRAYGGLPMVLAGGSSDPAKPVISEAKAMAGIAVRLGVRKDHIIVEGTSRNTLESAAAVAGILKKKRIVLVTAAFHMHRSVRMFEKQGFTVTPAPTAYLSDQHPVTARSFIPSAANMSLTSITLQEHISRAWYSLRGDI